MDGHHQRFVDFVEIRIENLHRSLRIQHDRRLATERTNALELDVKIAVRLDVDLNRLRAGLRERLEIEIRTVHHQMDVPIEVRRDLAAERDDVRTERHVRNERRIHDVDVKCLRPRCLGAEDVVRQMAVIRGQQRRKNFSFHLLRDTSSRWPRIPRPALPSTAPS